MSVTITIAENEAYCEEHKLVEVHVEDCVCKCGEQGKASSNCYYCKGSGKYEERNYPFDMNLANRNFYEVWKALGLVKAVGGELDVDDVWSGSLDGRTILAALSRTKLIPTREEEVTQGEGGATIIDCALTEDQVNRYFSLLQVIASEAARRESPVVWC
jgi:hypothetical protein